MPEYTPAYRQYAPFTLDALTAELETLHAMHAYATRHDDILVLDELVCRLVPLEHRLILWERDGERLPQVRDSIAALDRAFKWAWLARDEEQHASGMYAGKLKEAIAVLEDLHAFLTSRNQTETEQVPGERQPAGMTQEEAAALAATIMARLPQAEVEVTAGEQGAWVVEGRNPRRGTSQVFHSPEQFEQLLEKSAQRQAAKSQAPE